MSLPELRTLSVTCLSPCLSRVTPNETAVSKTSQRPVAEGTGRMATEGKGETLCGFRRTVPFHTASARAKLPPVRPTGSVPTRELCSLS